MRTWTKGIIFSISMIGFTAVSQARARVWIGINPFPVVVERPAPVVVAQPVLVADPYAPRPIDYRQTLNDFHNRVQRLQRVLDRQLNRRIISQGQYDRHATDLDQILADERQDAALHGGALTPREVDDLNRRLVALQDRIHDDIIR